jgi:NTP pyrophosphatase (non-canonical NTP hydrolase)
MVTNENMFASTQEIAREVWEGRIKAHQKHGSNSIEAIDPDDPRWLAILTEELGEVAHELTYDAKGGSRRAELLDVATVCFAWIAAMDRVSRWEYAVTKGARKAWSTEMDPPDNRPGWVVDESRGSAGWERFEFHEERYWKRLRDTTV